MSILMVLIGATIGATIGSLFMHWRSDVAKERQQLESETPYDYALANARADNNRYRDELFTIKALKRTEADTERIRNEIGAILSDDGEVATEGVYDPNMSIDDLEYATETYASGIAIGEWDEPYRSKFIQAIGRTSDGREYLTEQGVNRAENLEALFGYRGHPIIVNPTADGREYLDGVIPIQEHADRTVTTITWDNRISSGEMVDNISKAVARANGTNVREDDSKDEQLPEDDVERSLTEVVRQSFENKEIIRVTWRGCSGNLRIRSGVVDAMSTGDGKVKEFGMRGLEIFARDVELITKGDDISGETLYRKGNR